MTTKDYSKPQWFLIYTKPRQEERAKENLENQGFETFLPMIAFEKIKQPKLYSLKPMFPRYLLHNSMQIKITGFMLNQQEG